MANILDLMPELHEQIYNYCYGTDLLNLSCCNSTYNDAIKYIIWQKVRIPWGSLTKNWSQWMWFGTDASMRRRLDNLKDTTHLSFYVDGSENLEDEIQWSNICTNYEKILNNCNPDVLISLSLEGVVDDQGLATTCRLLNTIQQLSLKSCPHVTAEGWKGLASLKHLQWLEIDECDVSFDVMTEITKCVSLSRLHLHKNRYLGAEELRRLSCLPDLQRLHITYNRNLGHGYEFKFCGNLTHLDLRYTNITIASICTELSHLKVLSLRGCRLTPEVLRKISQLKMLEELDINGAGILGDWMEIICSMTSLQKLDMSHSGEHLTSESLLLIDSLSALRELHLGWNRHVNDDNLSIVSHLEFLRTLDVHRCAEISDAGLHHISTMKSLREINLNSCVLVTDVGISELAKIECLESLDVGYTSITNVGLFELSKLRVLTVLDITGCEDITEAGTAHLASCIYLRKLNISHTGVTDRAISHLQPLIYLKKLDVNSCVNLTNDSLRNIGALLSLESLCIGHNPHFNNFGLEHLKSLRSLRKLKCWHTRIDYQGLKKLAGCTLLKKIKFCKT